MRCRWGCATLAIGILPCADGFLTVGVRPPGQQARQGGGNYFRSVCMTGLDERRADTGNGGNLGQGINRKTAHRVVLVRHGESTWNRDERHIGWTGECGAESTVYTYYHVHQQLEVKLEG